MAQRQFSLCFVNVHDLGFLRLLFDGQKIFIIPPFVLEAIHELAD